MQIPGRLAHLRDQNLWGGARESAFQQALRVTLERPGLGSAVPDQPNRSLGVGALAVGPFERTTGLRADIGPKVTGQGPTSTEPCEENVPPPPPLPPPVPRALPAPARAVQTTALRLPATPLTEGSLRPPRPLQDFTEFRLSQSLKRKERKQNLGKLYRAGNPVLSTNKCQGKREMEEEPRDRL